MADNNAVALREASKASAYLRSILDSTPAPSPALNLKRGQQRTDMKEAEITLVSENRQGAQQLTVAAASKTVEIGATMNEKPLNERDVPEQKDTAVAAQRQTAVSYDLETYLAASSCLLAPGLRHLGLDFTYVRDAGSERHYNRAAGAIDYCAADEMGLAMLRASCSDEDGSKDKERPLYVVAANNIGGGFLDGVHAAALIDLCWTCDVKPSSPEATASPPTKELIYVSTSKRLQNDSVRTKLEASFRGRFILVTPQEMHARMMESADAKNTGDAKKRIFFAGLGPPNGYFDDDFFNRVHQLTGFVRETGLVCPPDDSPAFDRLVGEFLAGTSNKTDIQTYKSANAEKVQSFRKSHLVNNLEAHFTADKKREEVETRGWYDRWTPSDAAGATASAFFEASKSNRAVFGHLSDFTVLLGHFGSRRINSSCVHVGGDESRGYSGRQDILKRDLWHTYSIHRTSRDGDSKQSRMPRLRRVVNTIRKLWIAKLAEYESRDDKKIMGSDGVARVHVSQEDVLKFIDKWKFGTFGYHKNGVPSKDKDAQFGFFFFPMSALTAVTDGSIKAMEPLWAEVKKYLPRSDLQMTLGMVLKKGKGQGKKNAKKDNPATDGADTPARGRGGGGRVRGRGQGRGRGRGRGSDDTPTSDAQGSDDTGTRGRGGRGRGRARGQGRGGRSRGRGGRGQAQKEPGPDLDQQGRPIPSDKI